MNKKKLLKIILPLSLIIIIGGVIGTYYFLIKGPNIINWGEYQDEFYGYSIKYPKDWFLYPDEMRQIGYATTITSFDMSQHSGQQDTGGPVIQGELSIHIAVDDIGDSKNFSDWISKNPPPVGYVLSQSNKVIDGTDSIIQTTSETGLLVFIPKDNQIFIIQAEPLDSLENIYSETFDKMLNTFKFTK